VVTSSARHRVVTFAISLAALAYVQRVAISQAAADFQTDLALSNTQLGLIFGAFGLSYALFEVPNGVLADRFGVRATLSLLVTAWSVFTALTGVAWSFASLWLIRFLFGAGEAGCFPSLTRMLSAWLPAQERLKAQALMWACSRWAGAITPLLVLAIVQRQGWRWAFVTLAVLGFLWAGAFFLWFRDDPAQHPDVNAQELELLGEAQALTTQEGEAQWYQSVLKGPVLILLIQYFCFSFVWYFYITWLPTYLHKARHVEGMEAAGYAMLPLLLGGVGSLVAGSATGRLPRRRIVLLGFLASGVLLLAVTHIASTPLAMLAMGLASFCSDLTMPISWNACVEIGRRHTAAVSGAMNMFGNLAGFVAPVISGWILTRDPGAWNVLIYLTVAASWLAAACWMFLDPSDPQVAAPAMQAGAPGRAPS
jgi:sugar phosphate permease